MDVFHEQLEPPRIEKLGAAEGEFVDSGGTRANLQVADATSLKHAVTLKQLEWHHVFTWVVNGTLAGDKFVDGVRVVPFEASIVAIYISLLNQGRSSGTFTADFNYYSPASWIQNTKYTTGGTGTTLYTTQANRPMITGDDATFDHIAFLWGNDPDITSLSEGDIVFCDIDDPGNNTKTFIAQMLIKKVQT